jgi:RHS repeat-associated protein
VIAENDDTGLYYYRARYYNSQTGRFISQDPIGFGGGINNYAYVGDAPTGFVDPFGTDKSAWWSGYGNALLSQDTWLPKDSCIAVFFAATVDALNPASATPGLADAGEAATFLTAAWKFNNVVTYAASRPNAWGGIGLVKPLASAPVRAMMGEVNQVLGPGSALISIDLAIAQGFLVEMTSMNDGGCR